MRIEIKGKEGGEKTSRRRVPRPVRRRCAHKRIDDPKG